MPLIYPLGFSNRPLVETLISMSGLTSKTDFFDTNIAAAFDGNNNQDNTAAANCAATFQTVARLGKDLGSGVSKVISGVKTWGANNRGYGGFNFTGNIDLVLKASNTDPTTNSWTGTTIGTIATFANSAAVLPKTSLGNANSTGYRYVWIEITCQSSTYQFMGELEFYEWL